MKHHVIYVPGLGDHKTYWQDAGIQIWRLFGLTPHYLALGWNNGEGFDRKLARLNNMIDRLSDSDTQVSLVGVSAGASAVLNAYAENSNISKVVLICGKVQNRDNIHPARYAENPDFKESINRLGTSLEVLKSRNLLKNILSVYSYGDKVVPPEDAHIDGAANKTIRAFSHASVILNSVLLHGRAIAKFIKS